MGGIYGSREAAAAWRRGEAVRARAEGPATELMLDLAGVGLGSRVLDLGAGTGEQTLAAAGRVGPIGRVLATDIAADMLESAAEAARQAGLSNVETRLMDMQALDLESDAFDAAISRNGLQFVAELNTSLAEVRRVLRSGGKLAASVFSTPERNPFPAIPSTIARRRLSLPPEPGKMFALGAPGLLESAYRATGLRDVTVRAVELRWQLGSAAEALRYREAASPPLRELLARFGDEERQSVRAEIESDLGQFERADVFEATGEVLIVVGTK